MTVSELIRQLQILAPDMVVVIPSDEPQRAEDFVAVSEVTIDTVAPERGHPTNSNWRTSETRTFGAGSALNGGASCREFG